MAKFKYIGKVRTAVGDTAIYRNGVFELDAKDEHVKSLIAQGLLIEELSESKEAKAPKKSNK